MTRRSLLRLLGILGFTKASPAQSKTPTTESVLELKNLPGYGEGKILKAVGDSLVWTVDQTRTGDGSGNIKYLSQYPSLSAAISAINANNRQPATILTVDMDYTVGASGAIPSNVCLVNGGGILSVAAGVTLTIGSMTDCGNRRFFAGQGSVVFAKGAVPFFRIAWWLGNDLTLDATNAVRDIHRSFIKNGGGLGIVTGMRPITGNLYVPDSALWQGLAGRGSGTGLGSGFILTKANACIFKAQGKVQDENGLVGSPYKDILFRDIILDCNNLAGSKGLLLTGSYPNSIHSVRGENFTVQNATDVGVDCFSTGKHGVQIEDFSLSNYRFYNCQMNFRINTENSSITFESGFGDLRTGGGAIAFDVVSVGKMSVKDFTCVHNAPYNAKNFPVGGSKMFRFSQGVVNNVALSGLQDEGLEYFAEIGGTDLSGLISIRDSLIQSKIHFTSNGLRNLHLEDVTMSSGIFSDDPGAVGVITANHIVIRPYDRGNHPVVPHLIGGGAAAQFAGSSSFTEKNIKSPQNQAGKFWGHFNRFSLSSALSFQANPTTPAFTDEDGVGTIYNNHAGTRFGVQFNGQSIAEFGLEVNENQFYGMRCFRSPTTGEIVWQINQNVPFKFLNSIKFPKGKGFILSSDDGSVTKRITLNNAGEVITVAA